MGGGVRNQILMILQAKNNKIELYLKKYLKDFKYMSIIIFNSREPHRCYLNCLRLVRARPLLKLLNGPGPYDPGA